MPGTAVTQPNYADSGQSGSAYPTAIDAITQVVARTAAAFNPHAVPAAAAAPTLSSSAGGSLGARTYYAKITLVTPAGEVAPSAESNLALNANTLLNVASPTFALGVTGWNVYVGTASGNETKQNASPIAIGTAWVEPTGGLISGSALPAGISLMKMIVDAGFIPKIAALPTEVAAQTTGTITAPTTNPRNDIVYVDQTTGTVGVATGTEAASPSDPAVPAGKSAIARIRCTVGMTAIANSMIDDLRNIGALGLLPLSGGTLTGLLTQAAGANIASAATIDLTAATGNSPRITGTTPTSAVTMNTGQWCLVISDGAWPLTYNATTNKISGGVDRTLAAGDRVLYHKDASGIVHGFIMKADGTAVVSSAAAIGAVRNLTIYPNTTTPDSKVDVHFDEGTLLDSSGNALRVAPLSVTVDMGVTGAGGLDASSPTANTWYCVWAIAKADGTKSAMLSLSATAPTMPSGYTHKALLGCRRVLTTSPTVMRRDGQRGNKVFIPHANGIVFSGQAGSTTWANSFVDTWIPNIGNLSVRCASFQFGINGTGQRSVGMNGGASPYDAGARYMEGATSSIDSTFTGALFSDIPFAATDKIYWITQDTQAIYRLAVLDYTLNSVNAS